MALVHAAAIKKILYVIIRAWPVTKVEAKQDLASKDAKKRLCQGSGIIGRIGGGGAVDEIGNNILFRHVCRG
jgi:hypothetical protein